jgi:hypothetical protein
LHELIDRVIKIDNHSIHLTELAFADLRVLNKLSSEKKKEIEEILKTANKSRK